MDLLSNVVTGFGVVLTPQNILFSFIGVFIGNFVGVLPGIGPLAAISMLLPITFGLDATSALIMLAGIYYGTQYGSATTAIMLNMPGDAAAAVTCFDGYPMARRGRAGVAIFASMYSSFVGACIGILLMTFVSPVLVKLALSFSSAEYFALMTFGLIGASTLSGDDALKGLSMILLGLLIGMIGIDIYSGLPRYTFGFAQLMEGIPIGVIAIGLFGISEVIQNINQPDSASRVVMKRVTLRSMYPTAAEMRACTWPMLRGSSVGAVIGALPGVGATVASFLAYATEKRVAKDPSRFGTGAIEGIAAPEAANNAAAQTAFIPTLALGVPGSGTMALMLGALMINDIVPGPRFPIEHPVVFWGLIASFWLGNVMLLVLNIPLIGMWVSILRIPYNILYPVILFFMCVGVYSIHNSIFDISLALIFGLVGYAMKHYGFPAAPLLLGFVLGPLMEEHLRRAMLYARGDPLVMLQRPIAAVFFAASAALILWVIWRFVMTKRKRAAAS